jgi:hypothetical protein
MRAGAVLDGVLRRQIDCRRDFVDGEFRPLPVGSERRKSKEHQAGSGCEYCSHKGGRLEEAGELRVGLRAIKLQFGNSVCNEKTQQTLFESIFLRDSRKKTSI